MAATVLIVDDHPAFREVARELLQAEGFDVLGQAVDGASALAEVVAKRPDVVVLDVQLPDIDGFAVAQALFSAGDPPTIVLVSSRPASHYGARLRAAKARGFIQKEELTGAALAALL